MIQDKGRAQVSVPIHTPLSIDPMWAVFWQNGPRWAIPLELGPLWVNQPHGPRTSRRPMGVQKSAAALAELMITSPAAPTSLTPPQVRLVGANHRSQA